VTSRQPTRGESSTRRRLFFWTNLFLGIGVLAYVMQAYGWQAVAILQRDFSAIWFAGFLLATTATIVCLSWRWGYIIGGLAKPPGLPLLTLYRSAAHTLAVLIPSAKLGGDPLRAWLTTRSGLSGGHSIAGTVVDRTLEIGAATPFSVVFAVMLLQHGVPRLASALVSIAVGTAALALGVVIAVRRLRSGVGLVSALMRSTGASRWRVVDAQRDNIIEAETATALLSHQRGRVGVAFAAGLFANLLVVVEFVCLLEAFGLPSTTIAVVAALFATGAAHMFPVPAGVGVLEGAQMWIFEMLGYPADVGLAVGLAVRLREVLWMLPGVIFLIGRSLFAADDRERSPMSGDRPK
jgi:uncharacterized protein (TIRG00374 family)